MDNIKFVQAELDLYELWVNGSYFSAHPRIIQITLRPHMKNILLGMPENILC